MSYSQDLTVVVDIQFVAGNYGQLFAKEVVFLFTNSITPTYHLFKCPYSENELDAKAINQNKYTYNNINGLNWSDGSIEYNNMSQIFNGIKDFTIIVKGRQKQDFVKKFLVDSEIIDLDTGCSLKTMRNYSHSCPIHNHFYERCAINNVFKLLIFMEKQNLFK